jgi:hypothetical protein
MPTRRARLEMQSPILMVMAVLAFLAMPRAASAAGDLPDSPHYHGVRFDLHLDFGWYNDAGAGFRVELPVLTRGPLTTLDNDLAVSLGAELLYFYEPGFTGWGVFPIGALQWNFYLNQKWSVFPELGLAFLIGPDRDRYWRSVAAPFLGVGARYHFSQSNSLLLRVNWPAGLQVGIVF